MEKATIDCNLHDYIEVACLYKIEVILTLTNGNKLLGIPMTTRSIKVGGEFLEFNEKALNRHTTINLLSIKSMKAISPNVHFDEVLFI